MDKIEVPFPKKNSSAVPADQLERNILIYILNKASSCLLKSVPQGVRMEAEKLGYFLGIQERWE